MQRGEQPAIAALPCKFQIIQVLFHTLIQAAENGNSQFWQLGGLLFRSFFDRIIEPDQPGNYKSGDVGNA